MLVFIATLLFIFVILQHNLWLCRERDQGSR